MEWYNGPARSTEIMLAEFRSSKVFMGFADVPDDVVSEYIEIAKTYFSACERATLYLVAHLLSQYLANDSGTGLDFSGGAAYENAAVGELRAAYKSTVERPSDEVYMTTAYGRTFVLLRNACPVYRFTLGVVG